MSIKIISQSGQGTLKNGDPYNVTINQNSVIASWNKDSKGIIVNKNAQGSESITFNGYTQADITADVLSVAAEMEPDVVSCWNDANPSTTSASN